MSSLLPLILSSYITSPSEHRNIRTVRFYCGGLMAILSAFLEFIVSSAFW